MDHGEGYGGRTTSHVALYKYGGEGNGGASHQAPRVPPTNSGHPVLVPEPPTGARTGGHHWRYGDSGGVATLRRGRAGRVGLCQPPALDSTFQVGEWVTATDCRVFHGVAEQWAAPMGRLSIHDERPANRTGQAATGQTGWGRINLEKTDGKVSALGDEAGDKGRLWNRTTGQWCGGGYIGRHSHHARPLARAFTVRVLGVSPH